MDDTLKPIEAFVQQGLAQRFQQIFDAPLVLVNAPDKRAAIAKLTQRGLKYPFAFASISRDSITEGTYRPHTLMRRGIMGKPSSDGMTAQRLNLIPVTTEYEITFLTQSFSDVRKFSRTWLLAVIQNAFKFSVTYGVVDLDINVIPEQAVSLPQRESGLSEAKEYVATVNITVAGYMSNTKLQLSQVVNEIDLSIDVDTTVETVEFRGAEPIPFGLSTAKYVLHQVSDSPDKILLDLSLLLGSVNTYNIVLYGNRIIGFTNGSVALDGKRFAIRVTQADPGGFDILWDPESVQFGIDITSVELTQEVGKYDYLGFSYNHSVGASDLIAFARDYSATTA